MMKPESVLANLTQAAILPSHATTQVLSGILCVNLPVSDLVTVLTLLKNKLEFEILSDLFAADFPGRQERFEVVYNLLSLQHNARIILKLMVKADETVPSVLALYNAAAWYEREVYDMFGIVFTGNNDLRRILTDYGFVGHPLRKDFPLTGYTQVSYDADLEQVVYEPVKLAQEYREFDFTSPWQGPQDEAKKR